MLALKLKAQVIVQSPVDFFGNDIMDLDININMLNEIITAVIMMVTWKLTQ